MNVTITKLLKTLPEEYFIDKVSNNILLQQFITETEIHLQTILSTQATPINKKTLKKLLGNRNQYFMRALIDAVSNKRVGREGIGVKGHPYLYFSLNTIINEEKTINMASDKQASKNDNKKPDLSLIPYIALVKEAEALMVGEKKYGRYNYTKGHKASQLISAAIRHLSAWNEGQEFDAEDGQHHLGAARACLAMALRQQELGTLVDDRYKQETK